MSLSVGKTGSCHDNAIAESFFGHIKDTDNGNRAIDEGYRRKCAIKEPPSIPSTGLSSKSLAPAPTKAGQ